jgi:nucleoside-diphosphate-sugar epimerase
MRHVLVTGGFGFLGSHLIEFLLSDPDNRVTVVDNLSSSPLPLEDLLSEIGHPETLTYSLTDVSKFCRTNGDSHFDEIYHLASVVGPAGVLPHAGRMAASIINDTMAVAKTALEHGAN